MRPPRPGRLEGLIASPPCQDFSLAYQGRRPGLAGARGALVHEVMRWAVASRPEWVACEQVPPVAPIWRLFAGRLAELGYRVWCGVLDAADYGAPQHRRRAFLLAARWPVGAPPPTHRAPGAALFGGREWAPASTVLGPGAVATEHRGRPGAGWVRPTGSIASVRSTARPAPTVTTKVMAWRALGPDGEARRLRPGEIAALQGFPPGWPWRGPPSAVARQVGNAVPPPLARAALEAVLAGRGR
jgi:DNA (cytosine-5)-methyltransferase 1